MSEQNIKLLPCPFCGGEAMHRRRFGNFIEAKCGNFDCSVSFSWMPCNIWNKQAATAKIEQLTKEIENLHKEITFAAKELREKDRK